MKKGKYGFGILLVTRNNPGMVNEWYKHYDYSDCEVLNVDESTQKDSIKSVINNCNKLGISYQKASKSGLFNNLQQAKKFFDKKDIGWVLYMHHDAYPLGENVLQDISNIIEERKATEFGVIGFNILHGDFDLPHWEGLNTSCRTTARAPLERGDGWYRRLPHPSSRMSYNDNDARPFAVESVMWTTALINSKNLIDNIANDPRFVFFHAWDDIAFQFLKRNIYNVVFPKIAFAHDQRLKLKHKLPYSSPQGNEKKVNHLYGRSDHLSMWKDKWGFDWNINKSTVLGIDLNSVWFMRIMRWFLPKYISLLPTISRVDYKKVQYKYKGTLIDDFYNHDPKNGPIKYFDL